MARRKKNDGCLMSAIKLPFYLAAIGILVSIGSMLVSIFSVICGIFLIFGVAYLIFLIIRCVAGLGSPLSNINYDSMSGREFENFCAKVLRHNGFTGVKVTQGSGDHGIDVLADKGGKKYAFQCKCYTNNVGNKAVQEAYAGKAIYGADIAVVMTNKYFTKQAKSEARTLCVQLWDRSKLHNMVCFADRKETDITNNDIVQVSNTEKREDLITEKNSDILNEDFVVHKEMNVGETNLSTEKKEDNTKKALEIN